MKSLKQLVMISITLLATAAFAVQYPGSSSPGSTQPGQVPQSQGSMQPGQSAPGNSQTGEPQAAQPQQQQSEPQAGHPSIDDQVRVLTQELNLTPEQQTKMKNVLQDQRQQAMTIVNDSSLAREGKIQKLHSLREATITKARALLNDTQQKKMDAMLQQSEQMHQQQEQQSGSPASGTSRPDNSSPSASQPGSNPPSSNRPPR